MGQIVDIGKKFFGSWEGHIILNITYKNQIKQINIRQIARV